MLCDSDQFSTGRWAYTFTANCCDSCYVTLDSCDFDSFSKTSGGLVLQLFTIPVIEIDFVEKFTINQCN